MKQVIVFPRGQLTAKDKERLTKADVIAVEADHPQNVVMLFPSTSIVTGDDMLMAAFAGLAYGGDSTKAAFVKDLYARINERKKP